MLRNVTWGEINGTESESLSHVWFFATPGVTHSMEFSRPEYWSGEPFPSQGIFPTQGSNPGLPHCRQILYQLSHKGLANGTEGLLHCSVWFVSSVLALSPGTRWPQRRGGLTCTHGKASPYRQTWGGGQAALSALVAASLSSAQNTFTPKWPTCTVFRSPDVVKQGIPSSVGAGEAPSTRAHGEEPGGEDHYLGMGGRFTIAQVL